MIPAEPRAPKRRSALAALATGMVVLIVVTALAWHFLGAGRSAIEAPMRREIEGCPKRAGAVGGDRVIEGDGSGP